MKRFEKVIACVSIILFFASMAAIDSRSWWPVGIMGAAWIVLAIMSVRLGWIYDPEMEEEE